MADKLISKIPDGPLVLVLTVLSVVLGMFPSLLTGLLSPILTALL